MYILLLSYIAARLSDACLDPTPCHQITAEETCLQSRDSRPGYLNQPCTWCHGGACTENNDNRCEPSEWLFERKSTQINAGDYEIASIGLKPRSCPTIQDASICLSSKDSRANYVNQPCVWCDVTPCTTNNDNRCEPSGWLFKQWKQRNPQHYEVAVACTALTGDCLGSLPCPTINDVSTCLSNKDSRANYLNQPCTWCHGGACTENNDNRCEPSEWLFRHWYQIEPGDYEIAAASGLDSYPCYSIEDKELCLASKDSRYEYYDQPCVWCRGRCTADNPNRCEPSGWLFKQSNQININHYEVAVGCNGNQTKGLQNIFKAVNSGNQGAQDIFNQGSKYITFNLSNRAILTGLMYLVGILVVVNVVFLCYSKMKRQRGAYGLVKIDDSDDGDTESPMLE